MPMDPGSPSASGMTSQRGYPYCLSDLFDLLHSRHIVLWGKNPVVSSVHLVPVLKQAREGGAR